MAMPHAIHRFTVAEFDRMGEAGIFDEDDRVELLDGRIVVMSTIGGPHVACVVRLNALLSSSLERGTGVSVQNPVVLGEHSEPQPDIVLVRRPGGLGGAWLPAAGDVLLVIEVADTSLAHDRDEKLPLYAAAAIPEAWLVNLGGDAIEIHREPRGGRYTSMRAARRGDAITPLAVPDLRLRVDDILG
jgi:Uma2 family endonuclease